MLLHQRHYALVLRLDRRDRLDISALASRGCRWFPAVWRVDRVELIHQALQVPCAERGPGVVAGDQAGRDDRAPAACGRGRITASGWACSNRRLHVTWSSAPPPTAQRAVHGRSLGAGKGCVVGPDQAGQCARNPDQTLTRSYGQFGRRFVF